MVRSRKWAFGLVLVAAYPLMANADEQLLPLAESGQWVAMAHHASITAPPDVCLAINPQAGFALRADGDTTEVRVIDNKWSLPASVDGSIVIAIGDWNITLDITSNTSNSISADVEAGDVVKLLSAMDKAATMSLTVGKAKPIPVSLIGSAKVANAFRTCAGIEGDSPKGGDNPFQ